MKIVVTGAAGFIGSHTCERLVALGHQVVGVDCFSDFLYPAAPKRANAAHLSRVLPAAQFELVEGNICDPNVTFGIIDQTVDVVCHLAALAGVRPSLAQPLAYIEANVHGSGVVLQACRNADIQRIAMASSSSVYGVRGQAGQDLGDVAAFREDDPCLSPASPYAATKRSVELLGSTYSDLFGIGISHLRFFTVYGPRQRPDMAIHKFVRLITEGKPITLFGDGGSRRDYTYIDDIVAGTVAACLRVRPGSSNIYNLGGTVTTSLRELVAIIERTTGIAATIDWQPNQPGDVPITFADISNAERDLDYRPTTSLHDGIAQFWDWFQSQERH